MMFIAGCVVLPVLAMAALATWRGGVVFEHVGSLEIHLEIYAEQEGASAWKSGVDGLDQSAASIGDARRVCKEHGMAPVWQGNFVDSATVWLPSGHYCLVFLNHSDGVGGWSPFEVQKGRQKVNLPEFYRGAGTGRRNQKAADE